MTQKTLEEIKAEKDGLDVLPNIYRYAHTGFETIDPDDLDRMKWYGLFHRKQTPGFFMMRLRLPNGIVSSRQLHAIASLARDFGRGAAISLLMLVMVAAMSVVYVRRMLKVGEVE